MVNQTTVDGVVTSIRDLHVVHAVLHKEIVTGAMHSTAGVLKDPPVVNWKDTGGMIPVDRNNVIITPITTTQVPTGTGPSISPISIGSQKIEGPMRSIIPQEVRNAKPLNVFIYVFPAKHRDPMTVWSKVIGSKAFTNESADVYARSHMNFGSDTVLSESPNFMNFGLSSVNTMDEIGSVFVPTTRDRIPTNGSNWLLPGHDISEATADIMRKTKTKNHYNFNSDFETRRENQDFGRKNDPMSRPNLDSTPIGTNTTKGKTSPIDLI